MNIWVFESHALINPKIWQIFFRLASWLTGVCVWRCSTFVLKPNFRSVQLNIIVAVAAALCCFFFVSNQIFGMEWKKELKNMLAHRNLEHPYCSVCAYVFPSFFLHVWALTKFNWTFFLDSTINHQQQQLQIYNNNLLLIAPMCNTSVRRNNENEWRY